MLTTKESLTENGLTAANRPPRRGYDIRCRHEALKTIEGQADIMETHDPGPGGSSRLREAASILRRELPPVVFWTAVLAWTIVLCAVLSSCSSRPAPPQAPPTTLAAFPDVSQVEVLHGEPRLPTKSAPGRRALARSPFDCQAYAHSQLPWHGEPTSPVFRAVNDALLPDRPEFADRRKAACQKLKEAAP